MTTVIAFVGGTMDTERLAVPSAAMLTYRVPAEPGVPEETYCRLDPIDRVPVRFGLNPDAHTLANPEGHPIVWTHREGDVCLADRAGADMPDGSDFCLAHDEQVYPKGRGPNLTEPDKYGNVDCPDCWPHDDADCVCETCQGTGYVAGPATTTTTEGSPA